MAINPGRFWGKQLMSRALRPMHVAQAHHTASSMAAPQPDATSSAYTNASEPRPPSATSLPGTTQSLGFGVLLLLPHTEIMRGIIHTVHMYVGRLASDTLWPRVVSVTWKSQERLVLGFNNDKTVRMFFRFLDDHGHIYAHFHLHST